MQMAPGTRTKKPHFFWGDTPDIINKDLNTQVSFGKRPSFGHISTGCQLSPGSKQRCFPPCRWPCMMHEAFINTPPKVHLLLMLSLKALRRHPGWSLRPLLPWPAVPREGGEGRGHP